MRLTFLAAVCAAVLVTVTGVHSQQQFTIFANILDSTGASPATLQPTDVRVQENGADAAVVKVEPVSWPTKLQILVDNGVGLGGSNVTHLRTGVRGLLDALPPGVEVTLVTTAPQPRFLVRNTADRDVINKGFDLLSYDSGAGRFIESLNEATQRNERDKTDFFPAIIAVGTNVGDRNVLDRDVENLMKRLEKRPTTVHVVVYSGTTQSASGGANQTQIGIAVTQLTRGRYENINSSTRLATLLPEFGALVAKSHERQSHQFRITAQRPAGASGDVGKVSMGGRSGLSVTSLSFDGRIP